MLHSEKERRAGRPAALVPFLWVSIYLTCIFPKAFAAASPHRLTTPLLLLSYFSFIFVPFLSYCHTLQTMSLRRLELLSSSFSTVSQSTWKPQRLWWMCSNAFNFFQPPNETEPRLTAETRVSADSLSGFSYIYAQEGILPVTVHSWCARF